MPSFQFMGEGPTSYITGRSSVVLYLANIIYVCISYGPYIKSQPSLKFPCQTSIKYDFSIDQTKFNSISNTVNSNL